MNRDEFGCLSVDLAQILTILGKWVINSTWCIRAVEATGPAAGALERAADEGIDLPNEELVVLARQIEQVVDGEFSAREGVASAPWLILRAVDSTSWDISAEKQEVLDLFRHAFRVVREVGDVGYK